MTTTATRPSTPNALFVVTDKYPRIERTPRPYHAGACLVLFADASLDRPCNSLAAAKRYVAFVAGEGRLMNAVSAAPKLLNYYRSESNPGERHTVSLYPDGSVRCSCRGFSSHGYCWHHAKETARLSPPRLCEQCRLNPVADGFIFCGPACTRTARKADPALTVEPFDSFTPMVDGAVCGCVRCGKRYPFSDASPLLCSSCSQVALHGERRAS